MRNKGGQTALILILVTAAALILLAIVLNWGRIAQIKTQLSIAADQAAALLASEAASAGESAKQQQLHDKNKLTEDNGVILKLVMLVIAVAAAIFAGPLIGALAGLETTASVAAVLGTTASTLATAVVATSVTVAVVASATALALDLAVVQPGITKAWNKMMANQPQNEQFFEQGIQTALTGSVTDQVNLTDYFDANANGLYGTNATGVPNDTVGRFAFFYGERLKMLAQTVQTINPQVQFFYNQLNEFNNGQTCAQNEADFSQYPLSVTLNPACIALGPTYCVTNATDPACQTKIPNGFQLNDSCVDGDPSNLNYNPYCDSCCLPLNQPDPTYSATQANPSNSLYNASNPNPYHTSATTPIRPSSCSTDTSANGAPSECLTNNPYGSSYTLLYDPTYQNYVAGVSFLAQLGRDLPMPPSQASQGDQPQGDFPNGVYPFFWFMENFSPRVDNIDASNLQSAQLHWCQANGAIPTATSYTTNPQNSFPQLNQLQINTPPAYTCQDKDCCVNYLGNASNGTIDGVGNPNFAPDPAQDASFGYNGQGAWIEGDNQMCSTNWPYNGLNSSFPDGTCALSGSTSAPSSSTQTSTMDDLDAVMHTLSDFWEVATVTTSQGVASLSSSLSTWYPAMADWIAPAHASTSVSADPATGVPTVTNIPESNGRLLSIYNPYSNPPVDKLAQWNQVITNWLSTTQYAQTGYWCLPPQNDASLNVNGAPTAESSFIDPNANSSTWGDLPHVLSCLNYNSNLLSSKGSIYNFQQCQKALPQTGSCPSTLPQACTATVLGRSLAGSSPSYGSCDATDSKSYISWVNNSVTMATQQAPKFTLRYNFLNYLYNKALTMQTIFTAGEAALKSFLKPCGSTTGCTDGGPAAQLTYAYNHPPPAQTKLPNSVIYGWVDNPYPNGHAGFAHLIKVTAYAPGRGGAFALTKLPWVKTSSTFTTRSFTLTDRDGPVYVSVKRWDEDHDALLFPNGRPLWQMLLHRGDVTPLVGQNPLAVCNALTVPNVGGKQVGFGLTSQTLNGLGFKSQLSTPDQDALTNAFMLNDRGDGTVDTQAKTATYSACLNKANKFLAYAQESHACVWYIASIQALAPSADNANDYSLKFVSCDTQPEDLNSSESFS